MLFTCYPIGSGTFSEAHYLASSSVFSKHIHLIGDSLRTSGQGTLPIPHFILLSQLRHVPPEDQDEVQKTVTLNGQMMKETRTSTAEAEPS